MITFLAGMHVTSVSVNPAERGDDGLNIVYAGQSLVNSIDQLTEASLGSV